MAVICVLVKIEKVSKNDTNNEISVGQSSLLKGMWSRSLEDLYMIRTIDHNNRISAIPLSVGQGASTIGSTVNFSDS